MCGAHGNLRQLAEHLRLFDQAGPVQYTPRPPQPEPAPPAWLKTAEEIVSAWENHPAKGPAWSAYKNLKQETLERHRFGYGQLPVYGHYERRLTVPLIDLDGKIVGLVGRSTNGSEPKWLAAKGSKRILWNLRNVRPGAVVWVVENYADAAMIMEISEQFTDGTKWDAVATGMARALRDDEIDHLQKVGVKMVVVAMDNDLAGQASGETRRKLVEQWRAEKGFDPPAMGAGDKTAARLRARGIQVALLRWGDDMPAKADVGSGIAKGTLELT